MKVTINGEETSTMKHTTTERLALEVLAARWRLGEKTWTFDTDVRPALSRLELKGLIWMKNGSMPKTILAGLTEEGRKVSMSATYKAPRDAS